MIIESIDIVYLTCQFILPGYIIREMLSAIVPQKSVTDSAHIVESLGYSAIYIALWNWLFAIISLHMCENSIWYVFIQTIVVVVTACFTGAVIGIMYVHNIPRKLFRHFGVNLGHPVPTAWDYKFSSCDPQWVEVFLQDGKTVRGLYSSYSFSSSDSAFRDIYLEHLYTKEDSGWQEVPRTAGIWIHPNEIRYIKFYTLEE